MTTPRAKRITIAICSASVLARAALPGPALPTAGRNTLPRHRRSSGSRFSAPASAARHATELRGATIPELATRTPRRRRFGGSTRDPSGLGVEMKWMNPEQMLNEATNLYPGIVAIERGYFPIGPCLEGSGDPYFFQASDGAVVRIPHDAASEIGQALQETTWPGGSRRKVRGRAVRLPRSAPPFRGLRLSVAGESLS